MLPYAPQMKEALGSAGAWLVTAGGIAYTVGAVIYARRYPDPWVRSDPQYLLCSWELARKRVR